MVEQASLGAVHAGKGDQRGGNPGKLHCILQVHHGRGNVRNCGDSDPNTTSGGYPSPRERIRVTPSFSTFDRNWSQTKAVHFRNKPCLPINAPDKLTLRVVWTTFGGFWPLFVVNSARRARLNLLWHLTFLFAIVVAWIFVLRGRRVLRETTLMTAANWSLLAVSAWLMTWFSDRFAVLRSPQMSDHAWYACAVLALCPPIAVLGSRRPGVRVWTGFILIPMLLVLGWPVITLWLQGTRLHGLQLETPQLVAYSLVLVMGVGNYFGTRYTVSALLYAAAVWLIVVSSSQVAPAWLSDRPAIRIVSSLMMLMSIGLIRSATRRTSTNRFDQLWFDFFDTFGIAWGRRIQDRINYLSDKEKWGTRLEFDGFTNTNLSGSLEIVPGQESDRFSPNQGSVGPSVPEVESRIEHTIRWLLRRFVDPRWIDRRLGVGNQNQVSAELVDS